MTSKLILQTFDDYLKARVKFSQQCADSSARISQVDLLLKCGALEHLIPLLTDPSVKVQQAAALSVGRLINFSETAAHNAIHLQVIPLLVKGMDERTKFFRKSAMFAVRGLARHSSEIAGLVLNSGALDGVMSCMEDFDPGVKEAAIWAVSSVVKHCVAHAESAVSAGLLPYLKLALEEPELCIRQIAATALSDIARQDVTLAQAVVEAGVVPCLARCVTSPSPKLKQNAFCCLSNISKHAEQMAEIVLEADVASEALLNLGSSSEGVKKAAASLVFNIVKHHCQFSQLVVNSGGLGGLVGMISDSEESSIYPATLALGFISSESEILALAAINAKAVEALQGVLLKCAGGGVKAGAVWAIGQMGKHSAEHAAEVVRTNVLLVLLKTYMTACDDEDLSNKCKATLKLVIGKSRDMEYLEPLLHVAPVEILKYVVVQFALILPENAKARRLFVTSGSLKRLQEIPTVPGSTTTEYINIINNCFPEDIIRYYSPSYPETLLEQVEAYVPAFPSSEIRTQEDPEDADLVAQLNVPPKAPWESCMD